MIQAEWQISAHHWLSTTTVLYSTLLMSQPSHWWSNMKLCLMAAWKSPIKQAHIISHSAASTWTPQWPIWNNNQVWNLNCSLLLDMWLPYIEFFSWQLLLLLYIFCQSALFSNCKDLHLCILPTVTLSMVSVQCTQISLRTLQIIQFKTKRLATAKRFARQHSW